MSLDLQRQIQDMLARLERLEKTDVGGIATTYTPTYLGTVPGVTTYAANGQIGQYIRVGNLCAVSGRLSWTNATGTGTALISMPFTSVNRTNYRAVFAVSLSSYTFTANSFVIGSLSENSSNMNLAESANGAAVAALAVDTAATLAFAGWFEIA